MTVCDHGQKDLWNELIGADDEVYYHWGYSDAFYKIGSGIPTLFYLSDGCTRIYNVLMMRELWKLEPFEDFTGYYDVATPYGYGGTSMKGPPNEALLKQFFDEMSVYLKQQKVVAEYSRLDPVIGNVSLYDGQPYDCSDYSKTVCIRLQSPDQIWNDMKSSCRNRIRSACASDITVTSGLDARLMTEFRVVYEKTMKRRQAKPYYFFNDAFFESILSNLTGHTKIYLAHHDGVVVSALLILYSAGNAKSHLGGNLAEYMHLNANNFLHFEAAKDLLSMGCGTLLMGGGYGGTDDSLLQFKKTFAPGGVLPSHTARRIHDPETYDKLVHTKVRLCGPAQDSSYFPVYRA